MFSGDLREVIIISAEVITGCLKHGLAHRFQVLIVTGDEIYDLFALLECVELDSHIWPLLLLKIVQTECHDSANTDKLKVLLY